MPQPVLYLDEQVQLEVLIPNLLVGAAHVDLCGASSRITLLRLRTIHNMIWFVKRGIWLWTKALNTMLSV